MRNRKERIEVTASGHEDLFPVVPSQEKYVYVGGVWSLLGTPTSTSVLTLFSVCYSCGGIALSTMRSTWRRWPNLYTKVGALHNELETPNNVPELLTTYEAPKPALAPRVPKNPKSQQDPRSTNNKWGDSKFLRWKARSRSPTSLLKRSTKLGQGSGRSRRF